MDKYLTIRADVKDSTRNKKYLKLKEIVLQINSLVNDYIIPMSIRNGDEVFAIYTSLSAGLEAFQLLITLIKEHKVPLYIGVGYGLLDSEINDPDLINGQSIWNATRALESINAGNVKYNEKIGNSLCLKVVFGFDDEVNKYYQTLFFLLAEKISKRTNLQSKAVYLLKGNPNIEYYDLYDMIENNQANDSSTNDEKKNKFLKYLQRAEYFIVNDIVDLLVKEIE